MVFIARQHTTRDIDIANLSVCSSVRLSVCYVPVSDENGLTYRHSFYRAIHMHKRGICRHAVSVCLCVRLSVCHVRELRQNE